MQEHERSRSQPPKISLFDSLRYEEDSNLDCRNWLARQPYAKKRKKPASLDVATAAWGEI